MVGTRDYRLEIAQGLGAASVMNTREPSSPHHVEDLGAALMERHGRLPDRVIVATGSIPANEEALTVSGPGATIVFMGVTGPEDTVAVPMLASLIGDKTIRFSLWYPFQWPRTIALLEQGVVDTAPIITHRTSLEGLSESIERVMYREDGVIKTVVEVAKGGAS
jgi:threonine dehydrogenase-like Zn-dependent dehydrogenase